MTLKFSAQKNIRLAFMGMSGVGKTTLSNLLPAKEWFHYSIDYRLGAHYLHEEIGNALKIEALKSPALTKLIHSNAIVLEPNITKNNLNAISMFIGMVGAIEKGGLPLDEFLQRLEAHRIAEIRAMQDTPLFIKQAHTIYNQPHFICDFSGSVCELDAPEVINKIAQHCLIVYIKATGDMMDTLIDRAQKHPKPLYYQTAFLHQAIERYCEEQNLNSWQDIDPSHFAVWVFPHLVKHRLQRYEDIAQKHGITLSASDTFDIASSKQFLALIDQEYSKEKR